MQQNTHYKWRWLALIAGGFISLALAATFAPGVLNQRIGQGPATWGLAVIIAYLVFVITIMALVISPFGKSSNEENQ